MPRYYPVFLDLAGKPCLVVGGGAVAWRKAKALLDCVAQVTVVAPQVVRPLSQAAAQGRLRWVRRRFRASDLASAFLAVAATDEQAVNRGVFAAAQRWRRLVNVVDQPALCSFIVPSVMRRGALTIAISTAGGSPALSRWIRRDLARRYDARFARVLSRMRRWRPKVHAALTHPQARKRRFEALLRQEFRRAGIV